MKTLFLSVLFCGLLMVCNSLATPLFKTTQIKIKSKTITVEVAETKEQHSYGLMNRESLPENSGMLFVFETEDQRFFWMKNTFINLSIAYFDKNRKIIDIQDMKAAQSSLDENLPSYPSKGKAKYALEMNQGWFKKNNIKVGDSFSFFRLKSREIKKL